MNNVVELKQWVYKQTRFLPLNIWRTHSLSRIFCLHQTLNNTPPFHIYSHNKGDLFLFRHGRPDAWWSITQLWRPPPQRWRVRIQWRGLKGGCWTPTPSWRLLVRRRSAAVKIPTVGSHSNLLLSVQAMPVRYGTITAAALESTSSSS